MENVMTQMDVIAQMSGVVILVQLVCKKRIMENNYLFFLFSSTDTTTNKYRQKSFFKFNLYFYFFYNFFLQTISVPTTAPTAAPTNIQIDLVFISFYFWLHCNCTTSKLQCQQWWLRLSQKLFNRNQWHCLWILSSWHGNEWDHLPKYVIYYYYQ
jgi:hypothetical protein